MKIGEKQKIAAELKTKNMVRIIYTIRRTRPQSHTVNSQCRYMLWSDEEVILSASQIDIIAPSLWVIELNPNKKGVKQVWLLYNIISVLTIHQYNAYIYAWQRRLDVYYLKILKCNSIKAYFVLIKNKIITNARSL